jgi:hypothetical protein
MDTLAFLKIIEDVVAFIICIFIYYMMEGEGIHLLYWGVLRLLGKKITYAEASDQLGDFLFGWLKCKK